MMIQRGIALIKKYKEKQDEENHEVKWGFDVVSNKFLISTEYCLKIGYWCLSLDSNKCNDLLTPSPLISRERKIHSSINDAIIIEWIPQSETIVDYMTLSGSERKYFAITIMIA